ncbi:MAG: cell division protein ZipA C-terminal FtsZ-binding domain-containing protein [Gammaproteobacteria bacterium]|nr:cell division protein ZipA C-terminal FtsZ-binding domain-containing protein [Gammaproteobacteria bacterium]
MESFRWILLAVGVVFVLVIYVLGRSRRRRSHFIENDLEEDLPEFAAQNLDDFDEGVGEVRIITGADLTEGDDVLAYGEPEIGQSDESYDEFPENEIGRKIEPEVSNTQEENNTSDIVVLYILPKPEQELLGAHINSSAQAMGLTFGDMNIFHFKDNDRNVFSLANMLEPGSFDPDTIHDLRTTGLTVFMQFTGSDPLDDLTEMLQRSYQLSGLLGARLCNHKREPLTEQDAENYRTRARHFMNGDVHRSPAKA